MADLQPGPVETPVLPWSPRTGRLDGWTAWLGQAAIVLVGILAIVRRDQPGESWWHQLSLGVALVMMLSLVAERRRRVVIDAMGICTHGLVRERTIGWDAVAAVQQRGALVELDLVGNGDCSMHFDGRRGRPDAATVAAVIQRLRHANPAAGAEVRNRTSPDIWLVAVYVVLSITIYELF